MNENRGSRSPNWRLLLLVPAAVLLAKMTKRRQAIWQSTWGASRAAAGHGYGHHGPFRAGQGAADEHGAFRLPPKIESMLDNWHTRAHQAAESTEPPTI
ncbi:MAG TPA: hypothetical protein VIM24_06965, partial [Candidatus Limnocylindrales bacterium]|jgi:hypothetical protein